MIQKKEQPRKIAVGKITLNIGNKEIEMTVEEVRQLRDELSHLLGSCHQCNHPDHWRITFTGTEVTDTIKPIFHHQEDRYEPNRVWCGSAQGSGTDTVAINSVPTVFTRS